MPVTKIQIGTIDLTPTWEETARMCITLLRHSDKSEALRTAEMELLKMGRLLDGYVKIRRESL